MINTVSIPLVFICSSCLVARLSPKGEARGLAFTRFATGFHFLQWRPRLAPALSSYRFVYKKTLVDNKTLVRNKLSVVFVLGNPILEGERKLLEISSPKEHSDGHTCELLHVVLRICQAIKGFSSLYR